MCCLIYQRLLLQDAIEAPGRGYIRVVRGAAEAVVEIFDTVAWNKEPIGLKLRNVLPGLGLRQERMRAVWIKRTKRGLARLEQERGCVIHLSLSRQIRCCQRLGSFYSWQRRASSTPYGKPRQCAGVTQDSGGSPLTGFVAAPGSSWLTIMA